MISIDSLWKWLRSSANDGVISDQVDEIAKDEFRAVP